LTGRGQVVQGLLHGERRRRRLGRPSSPSRLCLVDVALRVRVGPLRVRYPPLRRLHVAVRVRDPPLSVSDPPYGLLDLPLRVRDTSGVVLPLPDRVAPLLLQSPLSVLLSLGRRSRLVAGVLHDLGAFDTGPVGLCDLSREVPAPVPRVR
jgi:hypothetical protein